MKIGGKNISNWWLIAGGGGVVLIWFLYKRGSSSSTAAGSAAGGTVTDPSTGQTYPASGVDPVTGMTYGQEIAQYGSVAAAESQASPGGGAGGGGAGGGYVGTAGYPTTSVGGTVGSATSSYATNAAWAQAVTAGLTQLGYSATDVATALGMFFAQQPLGTLADGVSAAGIVQAAEAEFGPPPQGTYSIIPLPPAGGGGGGNGGGGGLDIVPDVTGLSAGQAHDAITAAGLKPVAPAGQKATDICTGTSPPGGTPLAAGSPVSILSAANPPPPPPGGGGGGTPGPVTGLHITGTASTHFSAAWNGVSNSAGYAFIVSQLNGKQVASGTVGGTSVTVGGLHPGWTYNLGLQALPGGPGTNIHVTLPNS